MLPVTSFGSDQQTSLNAEQVPTFTNSWEIAVMYGPHGAPDFSPNKILMPSLNIPSKYISIQAVQEFG